MIYFSILCLPFLFPTLVANGIRICEPSGAGLPINDPAKKRCCPIRQL